MALLMFNFLSIFIAFSGMLLELPPDPPKEKKKGKKGKKGGKKGRGSSASSHKGGKKKKRGDQRHKKIPKYQQP